jgi:predicted amidohydrolase YtcJ
MAGGAISRRRFVRDGATLAVGTALGVPAATFAQQPGAADIVLRSGRVLTMRGKGEAEAVAVSAGRIAYVGSNSGAAAYAGPGTEVIDLRGRTLMPGIHDGHCHPLSGGLVLTKPTLNYRKLDLKPFLAALRKLLARSSEQEPDGWLSVDLWEPSGMDRQPTKKDLDRLPTRRPILVIDYNGHTAVANSRALAIAGITASTPNPPGARSSAGRAASPRGSSRTTRSGSSSRRFRRSPPRRTPTRCRWRTRRWPSRGSPPISMPR